jgi:hypothetical protein
VVGDRLDTDILGARKVGYDSLLVMTGVTDAAILVAAPPEQRPSYVAADLVALQHAQPEVLVDGEGSSASSGGWKARVEDGVLVVQGDGGADDWWRVVAVAGWSHLDATGQAADVSDLKAP